MKKFQLKKLLNSFLQREHPNVVLRVRIIDPKDIAVTVITAEEQIAFLERGGNTTRANKFAVALFLAIHYFGDIFVDTHPN